MAVNQIPITRGGKQYTITIGINAEGKSVLYVEPAEADPNTGNNIRYEVKELRIPFGEKSNTAYIHTTWVRKLIGPNGNVILQGKEFTKTPDMVTNEADQAQFIYGMGMPILISMVNGFVRKILGFNNLPVFNAATGAVLTYTPEQEATLPTNDYDTPNA